MASHFVIQPDGPHRMKEWLRENPAALPDGVLVDGSSSHKLRRALRAAGWTVLRTGSQTHLIPPGTSPATAPEDESRELDVEPPRSRGERAWVHSVIRPLQDALSARDPSLRVLEGRRLAYRCEVLEYNGDSALKGSGMRYETDILIAEGHESSWVPRVVAEAKLRTVSTHSVITYSQKAANHKNVHPYLRYGLFLGARRHHPLPGRLYRHGAEFDFMISWKGLEPEAVEFDGLVSLVIAEVQASRLLQDLMFGTRRRTRPHYTIFHRGIVAGGPSR